MNSGVCSQGPWSYPQGHVLLRGSCGHPLHSPAPSHPPLALLHLVSSAAPVRTSCLPVTGPCLSPPLKALPAAFQKTNVNQGLKPFAFSFQKKAELPRLVHFSRAHLWGPCNRSFYHSPVPTRFAVATRNQYSVLCFSGLSWLFSLLFPHFLTWENSAQVSPPLRILCCPF